MEAAGAVSSTSCQQASRSLASPSQLPENSKLNWMSETDGLTPFASFEKSSPNGVSWRTCPVSCLPGMDISEPYSATWPQAGLLWRGKCYRQRKWERRISGIDSGLWGTPNSHPRTFTPRRVAHGIQLANQVAAWPTPDTGCSASGHERREVGSNPNQQSSRSLEARVRGALNPEFVEWLMNWPIGWTSLEPLAEPIALGPETWNEEPDVPRVASGVENRVGRLKSLGNGQVPLCAAAVFRLLTERNKSPCQ